MSNHLLAPRRHAPRSTAVRARIAALCAAWTAYTLRRGIADVASTSDQDYRDFGLDKGEILRGLIQLREELEGSGSSPLALAAGSDRRECAGIEPLETSKRWPLAIVIVRRCGSSRLGSRRRSSVQLQPSAMLDCPIAAALAGTPVRPSN